MFVVWEVVRMMMRLMMVVEFLVVAVAVVVVWELKVEVVWRVV